VRILTSIILALAVGVAAAQTAVQVPAPACTAVVTCQGSTITIPSTAPAPAPAPAPTPTPTGATAWGYLNGVLYWAGDFTQGNTSVNYHHATAAGFNSHTQDILFTATAPYGLFLPYFAANFSYPNNGFTKLLITLKPQYSGQSFAIFMMRAGDIDPGQQYHKALLSYGPATVAGKWGSYVIPLADLGTLNDSYLYKLEIQDQTSTTSTNSPTYWEMDSLGFQQ
jgi:hypothetical protein